MIGRLPKCLIVDNKEWDIRSDYRDILNILCALNDPELKPNESFYVCLKILYKDFEKMANNSYEEAYEKAMWFINQGKVPDDNSQNKPKLMDWEQDETIMFAAINKVAGAEVRTVEYMHWWTFMGYYMSIGESLFSEVINIRLKKNEGKKLEKYEQEFYRKNKELVDLKTRYNKEEIEAIEKLLGMKE